MVGRAVVKEALPELKAAVGPQQFGLASDGCGSLHRALTSRVALKPGHVIVSMDVADAFSCISRDAVLEAVNKHCPILYPMVRRVVVPGALHVATGDAGEANKLVKQFVGLDQGCPLSPALYALATRDILLRAEAKTSTQDDETRVLAYLDDTYMCLPPQLAPLGIEALTNNMKDVGLSVNQAKTKIWGPTCTPTSIPPDLPNHLHGLVVKTLVAVGTPVLYAKASALRGSVLDDDRTDVPLSSEFTNLDPADFVDRQRRYFERLIQLQRNGLSLTHVLQLLRTWTQGAYVHILRAIQVSEGWAQSVDDSAMSIMETLLGEMRLDQKQQMFIPIKSGGLGMGSATLRRTAAFIGAWEGGIEQIGRLNGIKTVAALREQWPCLAGALDRGDQEIRDLTGTAEKPTKWQMTLHRPSAKRQREIAKEIMAATVTQLHTDLPHDHSVRLSACASAEGSVLLRPPPDEKPIPDAHMKIALRLRLGFKDVVERASLTCLNMSRRKPQLGLPVGNGAGHSAHGIPVRDDRRICGCLITSDGGAHALTCQLGGGVVARHDSIRDGLHEWMTAHGFAARKEQCVPAWDTDKKRAILDVACRTPDGQNEFVDVSVVAAATRTGVSAAQLLSRREKHKHVRYPGEHLIPFVMDIRGKWGREAIAWAKGLIRPLGPVERAEAAWRLRWAVAKALHIAVGEQVLTSMHGVRARSSG